jgi:hypothetical protein
MASAVVNPVATQSTNARKSTPPRAWDRLDAEASSLVLEHFPGAARTLHVAAPGAVPAKRPAAGRVACGERTCAVGREVCCASRRGDIGAFYCRPAATGAFDLGCPSALAEPEVIEPVATCDDASDCGSGAMCCHGVDGSMVERYTCQRPKTRGVNACLWKERCGAFGTCATKGTNCREGFCVTAAPRVACGKATCTDATPICCASREGSRCVARAGECVEPRLATLACRTSSDCGAGLRCCLGPGDAATCSGDCTNSQPLCASDLDCAELPGTRCVLRPDEVGLATCR